MPDAACATRRIGHSATFRPPPPPPSPPSNLQVVPPPSNTQMKPFLLRAMHAPTQLGLTMTLTCVPCGPPMAATCRAAIMMLLVIMSGGAEELT